MEDQERYIINNLNLSNQELSSITGLSRYKIKYILSVNGLNRTEEQRQQIMLKRGIEQTGSNNPNWKGGVSSDNYRYKKRQMERYPEKISARQKVHIAIKKGILNRQPCAVCGDPKSEGHHFDYTKPLEVRWLCRKHHREIENKSRAKLAS
jgi:ABC-type lipoprotein export system ATPase subunit